VPGFARAAAVGVRVSVLTAAQAGGDSFRPEKPARSRFPSGGEIQDFVIAGSGVRFPAQRAARVPGRTAGSGPCRGPGGEQGEAVRGKRGTPVEGRARVKAGKENEKGAPRRQGAQWVGSTGRGPHATEVDVGALDQPLLRMHEASGTGIRWGVNQPETYGSQCGQP